jgi:hypothetical protein
MTALTELLMIPKSTLETTNPTNAPALLQGKMVRQGHQQRLALAVKPSKLT